MCKYLRKYTFFVQYLIPFLLVPLQWLLKVVDAYNQWLHKH